jgi:hypothetical protein
MRGWRFDGEGSRGCRSPCEASWKNLLRVAERATNAAMEGGFLGFAGVRVSDKERAFIGAVRESADAKTQPAESPAAARLSASWGFASGDCGAA